MSSRHGVVEDFSGLAAQVGVLTTFDQIGFRLNDRLARWQWRIRVLVVLVRQAWRRRSRAGTVGRRVDRLAGWRTRGRRLALDLVAKIVLAGRSRVALAVLNRQKSFGCDATATLA